MNAKEKAEKICNNWDTALASGEVEALLSLYADDATVESPVIRYLLGTEEGICRGHSEIRALITAVMKNKPPLRKHHRGPLFTDGKLLMWEYPRETPEGEQMDFVEVMELSGDKIHRHRVYWGWRGIQVLSQDEYHQ